MVYQINSIPELINNPNQTLYEKIPSFADAAVHRKSPAGPKNHGTNETILNDSLERLFTYEVMMEWFMRSIEMKTDYCLVSTGVE